MRMKRAVFCIMVLFLAPSLISSAVRAERVLSVLPDTTVAAPGMVFSLDVAVNEPVDSLMGYNVTVAFDAYYLALVSVEEGSLPKSSTSATFFRWLNAGCACDSIVVNGSILGNTVDGPGVLFRLTFKALKQGKTGVALLRSDLRNGLNRKLSHSRENALVFIELPIGAAECSWSSVKYLYK